MGVLYKSLYGVVLRHIDPERAHQLGLGGLAVAQRLPGGLAALGAFAARQDPRLEVSLWGLTLASPLGIAAGMDKQAQAVEALFALGFGHVEVGTVTPRPQQGNPKPRLWRLTAERGLINAMGFPSEGAEAVGARLEALAVSRESGRVPPGRVVGVNLGKNRDTELMRATQDYTALIDALFDVADYFAINVSSPNTPQLRSLQLGQELQRLVETCVAVNRATADRRQARPRPLLVKLAPDLEDEQLQSVARAAVDAGADGLIATNTTVDRTILHQRYRDLPGGLSGQPLRERARRAVGLIFQAVGPRVPIIGVGGVSDARDVVAMIRAGASLVQMYTGFIYGGLATAGEIAGDLSKQADAEGWNSISELVGIDAVRADGR